MMSKLGKTSFLIRGLLYNMKYTDQESKLLDMIMVLARNKKLSVQIWQW